MKLSNLQKLAHKRGYHLTYHPPKYARAKLVLAPLGNEIGCDLYGPKKSVIKAAKRFLKDQ